MPLAWVEPFTSTTALRAVESVTLEKLVFPSVENVKHELPCCFTVIELPATLVTVPMKRWTWPFSGCALPCGMLGLEKVTEGLLVVEVCARTVTLEFGACLFPWRGGKSTRGHTSPA